MTRYDSIDVVGGDDDIFEEPAWKRLITLVSVRAPSLERAPPPSVPTSPAVFRAFAMGCMFLTLVARRAGPLPSQVNIGLLLFAAGGLTYLTEGWDPTAFLCTAGYVMCGLGLALPSCIGSAEETKLRPYAPGCSGLYRFAGTLLNILGLLMGIAGSLMYSPTVNEWLYKLDEEEEHEWMREFANIIWAVSFFLFPAGVGLFLAERRMTLTAHNAVRGRPPPGIFHKNLRVLTWSFIMLCVCAVGGVFFCFDEEPGAELTACLLFGAAGCIKFGLLVVELCEMAECCGWGGGGGGDGRSREDGGVGEQTPLTRGRGDSPTAIEPNKATAEILGDPSFSSA